MTFPKPGVFFVIVLAITGATQSRSPVAEIVGSWQGTSTCVDRVNYPACNDETVIYDVDSLSRPPGTVNVRADKVVNGVRDSMGVMQFTYDTNARTWWSEFTTPRYHSRFTLTVTGNVMTGSLIELPSRRQVRRMSLKRSPSH